MRLKLKLSCQPNSQLPINYNYQLFAAVYQTLKFGSEEFASFLHDIGFKTNGKKYKLFTFALRFEKIKISDNKIILVVPTANLFISSPLIEDFIDNFVMGSFENRTLRIDKTIFSLEQIESLPEIIFKPEMKFLLLSPLVLSTLKNHNGKLSQYFLRPSDETEINRILTQNLKHKYKIIYKKNSDASDLILNWDDEYLKRKKRITKKITINENGKNPVDVIGMQAPFTLKGDPELIKVGYECGFGEKNSMGFGMVDTAFTT